MKNIIAKIVVVMLAAAFCASFAGCSRSEKENGADNSGSISDSQSVSPEESGDNGNDSAEEGGGNGDDTAGDDGAGESGGDASASEEDTGEPEENVTEPEESTAPEEDGEGVSDGEDGEADGDDGEAAENTETAVIVPEGEQNGASDAGKAVAETAMSAVGYDFLFGGSRPEDGGFDNSGVIYYALTKNGISCPRQLGDIMAIGTQVDYDGLSVGDPVFFRMDDGSDIIFGGVYVGDGQAVMSFSEGIPVKLVDITTSYYRSNFVCGVRAVS